MEEEEQYSSIEKREIKGLTVRNFISIIIATITIVSAVLLSKNSLEDQIRDVRNDQITYGKINDMNFKISDAKFQYIQNQIDEINKKIEKIMNDRDYKRNN